jgi:predicted alpha-1,2-mannosidase
MEATMIPWRDRGPITELEMTYFEKGFFPALPGGKAEWISQVDTFERRQSVAVTLEHCYDDWCLAQMAGVLNKNIDYDYFMKRAHNYQTLYDARIGFMAPKTADGKWVEPFDPKLSGGQGGRAYFAECNSWIYTWHVQHDMQGLIDLMGGREKFAQKLDALFVEQYGMLKFKFLNQFPDATGLIGQYAQGNEPSFHIPYLYNYAGAPWKTQRRVREIMKIWYDDDPQGICGDEDGGSMSAWYVFSAIGFYPVCPGRPVYDIGSPVFEQITIKVGDGKKFVIRAINVSAKNKYIQSATLNGKTLNKPWFEHSALVEGGELVFNMGDRPNKDWGSAADAAPPSGE